MGKMDYANSTRILSGNSCLQDFQEIKDYGKKCLIVTGRHSAKVSGALDDVIMLLEKSQIAYEIFDKIGTNPLLNTCFEGGKRARAFGAEFIVGIGGGSPLDAAKAIAVFGANKDMKKMEILSGFQNVLPILAVPTTVGTGSEVTQYAILTVPELETKKSVAHPALFPKIAFLDVRYIKSLPDHQLALTAADAFSHAVEGYLSAKASIVSDALAEAALIRCADGMRKLACHQKSPELLEQLLYGSTLGGMVIARTGTCFAHGMGYSLTYYYGVPHGEANAYFLAEFVKQMKPAIPQKVEKLLLMCNMENIEEMDKLLHLILPMKQKINEKECRDYTGKVFETHNVENGARILKKQEIYDIYCKLLLAK